MMARRPLPPIAEAEWQAAVDDYELGHRSGRQIARDLGISPATVCRRLKKFGAIKASRVEEVIAPVRAAIDNSIRERAARDQAEWDRNFASFQRTTAALAGMIGALLVAAQSDKGTLAAAAAR